MKNKADVCKNLKDYNPLLLATQSLFLSLLYNSANFLFFNKVKKIKCVNLNFVHLSSSFLPMYSFKIILYT